MDFQQMTPRSPSSKASLTSPYANPTALGSVFELADSENYERGTIE